MIYIVAANHRLAAEHARSQGLSPKSREVVIVIHVDQVRGRRIKPSELVRVPSDFRASDEIEAALKYAVR